ncbi:MAG: Rne/Rng family ribonuclease [Rickettsiales bacterium]|jgi:ribonuclease E|nr:Rne/Rng family ribonuclease [Rickettsiales bacterium]
MTKKILIDGVFKEETRIAVVDNGILQDYDREDIYFKQQKGNIYLAEVTRVEHSLQAAFVIYGGDRHGFLPFADIHPDYYDAPEDKLKDLSVLKFFNNSDESGVIKEQPKYKIKVGQLIVIQVLKEERGEKGVAVTTYVTLAGKYCVLMCNSGGNGGVSRKVINSQERKFLRDKITSLNVPKGMSIILRTAVKEGDEETIEKDYNYLTRLWNFILATANTEKKPMFLHSEEDVIKRTIRDIVNKTTEEILVEGTDTYNKVKQSVDMIYVNGGIKVTQYKEKLPLFYEYKVEEQLIKMYENKVLLPSGASLVIDVTEALIAIDINSGKSNHNNNNIEDTAYKTNVEAAKEIGRQLKLRDLAGLIVVDFIDMEDDKHKRSLENIMRQATNDDRARIQIARISQFGLLEMSRQRLVANQREKINEICPCCQGSGKVKSIDLMSMSILRDIRYAITTDKVDVLTIETTKELVKYLTNFRKNEIVRIEKHYEVTIFIEVNDSLSDNNFIIRKRQHLTDDEKDKLNNRQEMELDTVIEDVNNHRKNKIIQKQQQKVQQKNNNNNNHKKPINNITKKPVGLLCKIKNLFN